MNFRIALILGVSSLALLGGCATSRSELNIHAPTAPATAQIPGKEILVVSVADRRTFEAAPLS
ncbi:MAG: hypothetical protein LBG78_06355, partial [Azoarcus sp.]|nr:hypothetical protein [Azoarcus sp.]